MARALSAFPDLCDRARALLDAWRPEGGPFDLGAMRLEVVTGDARETLPGWEGRADAWFLDGFSPARNPELWQPDLMADVARHTAPGGTAATYSAAGPVRRALEEAGFEVTRAPGYGRKRHMTTARMP
jgi:tRNA U34 5-methylaminomethyl-2-thiouridine-forming methyltransferase MnmC